MERILVKISGESISGTQEIIKSSRILEIIEELKELSKEYSVSVVIGAGNIWRGSKDTGLNIDRNISDGIGMISTVLNATVIASAINAGQDHQIVKVFSPLQVGNFTMPINYSKIEKWLSKKGNIAFFAGGTGNPFFTTDSGAALRAAEIKAKWIVMGKNGVDGIYSADPKTNPNAVFYDKLSYREVFDKQLKIMDLTALTLCMENNIKIIIFNANQKNGIKKALMGNIKSTIVE